MISFELVREIIDWWEANAKDRPVGVLLRGQQREIRTMFSGWVLGFPDNAATRATKERERR